MMTNLKMHKPTIIALAGAEGVGKDSVGLILSQSPLNFKALAFADILKQEVAANWYSLPSIMFSRLQKDTPSTGYMIICSKNQNFIRWFIDSQQFYDEREAGEHYPLLKQRTPRQLLNLWSTWQKSINGDDVYERAMIERLRDDVESNYVITDLRLDREHARCARHAEYFSYVFECWEIVRPDHHYSNRNQYDMRLPNNLINFILHNDGDLDVLKHRVGEAINPLLDKPLVAFSAMCK